MSHKIRATRYILAFICLPGMLSSLQCKQAGETVIDYLGQSPPGMEAKLFAPGLISTHRYEHSAPAFSPDGAVVLWTVMDTVNPAYLLEMQYENGRWSAPAKPSFSDSTADDYYPSFSPDGSTLYFSSRRKLPVGYPAKTDIHIWSVTRQGMEWDEPKLVDTTALNGKEYAHSVAANGTIYFSGPSGGGTNFNISRTMKNDRGFGSPLVLPYNINSVGYEDGPYISPDEDFLIFESQRPKPFEGDLRLYISFRQRGGEWGVPLDMGPKVNSGKGERFARLSPDQKYLFFGSYRNSNDSSFGADIFWIDARVIDELRSQDISRYTIPQPLGNSLIDGLNKNDIIGSDSLLTQWLKLNPSDLGTSILKATMLRKQQRYHEADSILSEIAGGGKVADIIIEKSLSSFGMGKDSAAIASLQPFLEPGSQQRQRLLTLSDALFEMNKFEQSDAYFSEAMKLHPWGVAWYNRACGYTHKGEKGRAFYGLNMAATLGYDKRKDYESDPDLVPLHQDERWKVLLKRLKP